MNPGAVTGDAAPPDATGEASCANAVIPGRNVDNDAADNPNADALRINCRRLI